MNDRFGFQFFLPTDVQDTTKFILYNLHWDTFYYQGAFDAAMKLTSDDVRKILESYGKDCIDDSCESSADDAIAAIGRYKKFVAAKQVDKAGPEFLKLVHLAEDHLTRAGFDILFGGQRNYLIYSTLEGFRKGSESGDAALTSSSLGEYGSANGQGPIRSMESMSGMTDGEFLIGWVLKRAL